MRLAITWFTFHFFILVLQLNRSSICSNHVSFWEDSCFWLFRQSWELNLLPRRVRSYSNLNEQRKFGSCATQCQRTTEEHLHKCDCDSKQVAWLLAVGPYLTVLIARWTYGLSSNNPGWMCSETGAQSDVNICEICFHYWNAFTGISCHCWIQEIEGWPPALFDDPVESLRILARIIYSSPYLAFRVLSLRVGSSPAVLRNNFHLLYSSRL